MTPPPSFERTAEKIVCEHWAFGGNTAAGITLISAISNALRQADQAARQEGYAQGLADGHANAIKNLNLENPSTSTGQEGKPQEKPE